MKNHLKRLNTPKSWNVQKRNNVFIAKANPGGHAEELGMPIVVVIRDLLGLTNTSKETVSMLQNTEVLINGKRVKDIRHQIGLMDVLTLAVTKKHYRILLNWKGKLEPTEIKEEEAKTLLLRVAGKQKVKGNKIQLNLFGGRNVIADKDECKVGDTVVFDPKANKIIKHYKYEKGMNAVLTGGNHIGQEGTIEDVRENNIIYKNKKGDVFETLKKYAYILGK